MNVDTATLPRPTGVAPNQPFSQRGLAKVVPMALVALAVVGFGLMVTAKNSVVLSTTIGLETPSTLAPAAEQPADGAPAAGSLGQIWFSQPFELDSRKNVQIRLGDDYLDNDWIFVAGDLIEESTGDFQSFEIEFERYSGVEGGEAWTEGARYGAAHLPAQPKGRYVLRLEIQRGSTKADTLDIEVREGLFRWPHFMAGLFFIGGPALLLGLWHYFFERKRWKDSDWAPKWAKSGGGDDDDGGDDE
jgi:hypothetical protein